MTIEGRPRFASPPSADDVARRRAEIDALRRQRQEADERSAPVRRRLLEAGPPLRDVDAAMECHDSCHPRVDVTDHHQGGSTCLCQLSEAERAEKRRSMLAALAELGQHIDDRSDREGLEEVIAELDVSVDHIGGMAPFQITATVDGRSFYLRSRHDRFTLELAPADDPALFTTDPLRWGVGELVIATGGDEELGPRWADSLAFCVGRVRDYLRQQACHHVVASESGSVSFRFCPLCGVRSPEVSSARQGGGIP